MGEIMSLLAVALASSHLLNRYACYKTNIKVIAHYRKKVFVSVSEWSRASDELLYFER